MKSELDKTIIDLLSMLIEGCEQQYPIYPHKTEKLLNNLYTEMDKNNFVGIHEIKIIRDMEDKSYIDSYNYISMTPSMYLKKYRQQYNLTQNNLAEKVGVKRHHITEMESGKRGISKKIAIKLSSIFNAPLENFIQ